LIDPLILTAKECTCKFNAAITSQCLLTSSIFFKDSVTGSHSLYNYGIIFIKRWKHSTKIREITVWWDILSMVQLPLSSIKMVP